MKILLFWGDTWEESSVGWTIQSWDLVCIPNYERPVSLMLISLLPVLHWCKFNGGSPHLNYHLSWVFIWSPLLHNINIQHSLKRSSSQHPGEIKQGYYPQLTAKGPRHGEVKSWILKSVLAINSHCHVGTWQSHASGYLLVVCRGYWRLLALGGGRGRERRERAAILRSIMDIGYS